MNGRPLPRPDDAGVVCVVDDDEDVRKALKRLLRSIGLAVETFSSPEAFLAYLRGPALPVWSSTLQLPGQSGLDLQTTLRRPS